MGDVHGGLGDPVHVDQPRPPVLRPVEPVAVVGGPQRVAAEDHGAQAQFGHRGAGLRQVGAQPLEGGRRLAEHGDALGAQQCGHRGRIAHGIAGHHHDPAALGQRAPQLPDGEVEGVGVRQRPHVPLAEVEPLVGGPEQPGGVAVRDDDALGLPGGPGGVDDVGGVARCRCRVRHGGGTRTGRCRVVHHDGGRAEAVGGLQRRQIGHDEPEPGVADHELQPRRRVSGIQRHVGAAGLPHAQDGDRQQFAARHAHPDPALRTHAAPAQFGGELPGSDVQLGVCQGLFPATDRDRAGPAGQRGGEQFGQQRTGIGLGRRRLVPPGR